VSTSPDARSRSAIFFAVAMVAALGLWGLLLRRITKDQHDRVYGGRQAR
jgi:hypothetical protein